MNPSLNYEIQALAFYRMTGLLAPGKDAPAAGGPQDYDERNKAWIEWREKYGVVNSQILKACEENKEFL